MKATELKAKITLFEKKLSEKTYKSLQEKVMIETLIASWKRQLSEAEKNDR